MQIKKDSVVSIDYILTDDQGNVLDSSKDREPLAYLHGYGGIIPGLESQLDGRQTGDQLQVSVAPEDGYGQRNESLCQEVPRSQFDGIDDLDVGMRFRVDSNAGPMVITVTEINDDSVTVDGNHPLAGVPLNFDVTVRDVRDATAEELEHGHVHPPGGHGE
jgi:FKBP-type peptidyl-prolyl cis-trans isomerase SlyD